MQFISNNKLNNHLEEIKSGLLNANEVNISIAFLKESGLNTLLPSIKNALKSNVRINVIAGQNFALTEPQALHSLRNLFKYFAKAKLFIAKADQTGIVFHPKLYLFQKANDCIIIVGSANITKGGLQNNVECSLRYTCSPSDSAWRQAQKFFIELLKPENAEEATLLSIKRYESFYNRQKSNNKKARSSPDRKKSQNEFDYINLLRHFSKFDNNTREENYKHKKYHYKEARKVLDQIADDPLLTKAKFEPLLDSLVSSKGEYGWWHSGSLFRLRKSVYPYFKEFQRLVKYVRSNKNKPGKAVFTEARKLVKPIEGASVNYVAEIMMTYNSKDFANLNKNPITVLRKEGDVNIKASSESFNGMDYSEYCELVKEISEKLGLHDMLEVDSFFNDIYWKIKKKKKK